MGIITFTSDFGLSDAWVAMVKARILSLNANITLVDVSHLLVPGSLSDAAFSLIHSYGQFPAGSVHLAAIDSVGHPPIAMHLNQHYFVGADNGLFSLIAQDQPFEAVALDNVSQSTFPAKDVFAPAAVQLATGKSLNELGTPLPQLVKKIGHGVKATLKKIEGNVVYVDAHGNAITNIKQQVFNDIVRGRNFEIQFGRERATQLNTYPTEVDSGDWFVFFNHLGLLEIGIRNGSAVQLLGLDIMSAVGISFEEM